MFPNCYLNHMNSGYRTMPPMPSPSMFPGGMSPEDTSFGGTMQDHDMEGVKVIPGNTSAGAPTPGGTPGNAPTGIAGPGSVGVTTPSSPFVTAPGAPVVLDTNYTQGYLRTQIGKRVRITFLLGTNTLQDRVGILQDVGISYVIIKEPDTGTNVLGDIYSIKFVDIFPSAPVTTPGTA
ncbi:hypothetical protein [Clostridium sp. OS1-26]|uniref:hypothetical protein n=1 Tax=Clostridium sp. OS1-26 TaxID=3070681 RepID=UPI0027E10612|nr:hypothetical protein [Clostridium sp. OS1-26]WML36723.1 hypothetical protein RCG18_08900 [Clostridium sp. OS1-26]